MKNILVLVVIIRVAQDHAVLYPNKPLAVDHPGLDEGIQKIQAALVGSGHVPSRAGRHALEGQLEDVDQERSKPLR